MIYILSDVIRSGKTSSLMKWSENVDVAGILSPDKELKRCFFNLKTKKWFAMECDYSNETTISIGQYHFLKDSFFIAKNILLSATQTHHKYLVIDEIGKLELHNEGFYSILSTLITTYANHQEKHLVLVIRTSLLTTICSAFQIKNYTQINQNTLKLLK